MELVGYSFFSNALLMSLLLSLLFGLLSFFVVLRRMSFLGAGIAHTAFGGVALGVLLGIHPFFTSLGFCLGSALLIGKLSQRTSLSLDASIGIFFSFSMALGAVFIALRRAYSFDLSGYLFGSILGIKGTDLFLTLAATLVVGGTIFLLFHKLFFMTFDEETARASGVKTDALDTLLLLLIALVVVVSMKIVGLILISALTVLPASFGRLLSRHYYWILGISVLFSLMVMVGGLLISTAADLPAGATMVVLATLIYLATAGIRILYGKVV